MFSLAKTTVKSNTMRRLENSSINSQANALQLIMASPKVAQLNVKGLRPKLRVIESILSDKGIHVACFNETKTKQPPHLRNFILAAIINDNIHGSAIYIEGLNYRLFDHKFVKNNSKTNEKLEIRLTEADVDITLIYFHPAMRSKQVTWSGTIQNA